MNVRTHMEDSIHAHEGWNAMEKNEHFLKKVLENIQSFFLPSLRP